MSSSQRADHWPVARRARGGWVIGGRRRPCAEGRPRFVRHLSGRKNIQPRASALMKRVITLKLGTAEAATKVVDVVGRALFCMDELSALAPPHILRPLPLPSTPIFSNYRRTERPRHSGSIADGRRKRSAAVRLLSKKVCVVVSPLLSLKRTKSPLWSHAEFARCPLLRQNRHANKETLNMLRSATADGATANRPALLFARSHRHAKIAYGDCQPRPERPPLLDCD